MKNNKAFTLIELIAIISIIAIILLLAFTNINKIQQNRKEKLYEDLQKVVISAAKDYYEKNSSLLPQVDEQRYITVGELITYKFLEDNIKNPITNDSLVIKNLCVTVKKETDGKFTYTFKTTVNDCVIITTP